MNAASPLPGSAARVGKLDPTRTCLDLARRRADHVVLRPDPVRLDDHRRRSTCRAATIRFYHARRILDAAIGARGFYEFDERLHVPDGAWIPWPWAYDYLMAKATQVALWLDPALDPMAFISYVPVAWILVNAALFLAVCRAIGLSREMQLLAMLCFALSPLTQLLHCDRHGRPPLRRAHVRAAQRLARLALVRAPRRHRAARSRSAVALGRRAGVSQRPVHSSARAARRRSSCSGCAAARSAARGTARLRDRAARHDAARAAAFGALSARACSSSACLSWFHFYVAVCTAAALAFMAWRPFTRATSRWLGALCAACWCRWRATRWRRRVPDRDVFDPRPDRRGPKPLQAVHATFGAGRDGELLQLAAAARTVAARLLWLSRIARDAARAPLLRRRRHVRPGAAAQLNSACTTSASSAS